MTEFHPFAVSLSLTGPSQLVELEGKTLEQALRFSLDAIFGHTELHVGKLDLIDDGQIVFRIMELITFAERARRSLPVILEFQMEPVGIYREKRSKLEILDFYNRGEILSTIKKDDLETALNYIDDFVESTFGKYSGVLVQYFIERQFVRLS